MKYPVAKRIADYLVVRLSPSCERCEIAGGVRRQKPDPHDIELVVLPLPGAKLVFGEPPAATQLEVVLRDMMKAGHLIKIKGKGKYQQYRVALEFSPEPVYLDLFIQQALATWVVNFTLRTGPDEFSKWLVTRRSQGGALPNHLAVRHARVWDGDKALDTPEEIDFLNVCGLDWIEPRDRMAHWRMFG
jgi:DNA polymerase/3'-5' exonuclease PolX